MLRFLRLRPASALRDPPARALAGERRTVTRFSCMFLRAGALCSLFAASAFGGSEPTDADGDAHFFMPALEVGPAWSSDPRLDVGVLFRTSLEYRFRRVRAPFLRASYDATTAGFHARSAQGTSLDANAGFHDLLLGGGARFGPDRFQVVAALQGGLQIREVPELRVDGSRVRVEHDTRLAPIGTAAVGTEWYLFPGVAVTTDLSARLPMTPEPRFGGAFTLGVTTAL